MDIEFDPAKRERTLKNRGLDFLDAPKLYEGRSLTVLDDRKDYGEERFITYGFLNSGAVALDRSRRRNSNYFNAQNAYGGS